MEEIKKKFLQQDDTDPLHIGNLVHWEIKQQNLKKKDVADELGINPDNTQSVLQTIFFADRYIVATQQGSQF